MRDHTKLKVFGLADRLVLAVYAVSRKFPEDERFGLTAQVRRAAVSIAANIVEGSARPSEAEYVRMLTIACASAKELQYELSICARLQYIRASEIDSLVNLASQTTRALWALVGALRRKVSRPDCVL
jgi:four helix bundle protein